MNGYETELEEERAGKPTTSTKHGDEGEFRMEILHRRSGGDKGALQCGLSSNERKDYEFIMAGQLLTRRISRDNLNSQAASRTLMRPENATA